MYSHLTKIFIKPLLIIFSYHQLLSELQFKQGVNYTYPPLHPITINTAFELAQAK